jgi:hypothetical protein
VRDRCDELVERRRIKREIGAKLVELQGLVIDHRGTRLEREHVFARGLRVHRDDEIDLLLSPDVPVSAGADRVPRRQARNIGREHVLAGDRHAHLENRTQQDKVGGLTAGTVNRGDLDGKVVDNALRARARPGFLNGDVAD